MLVKELSSGSIVWYQDFVVGIKGATLPEMFDDCKCRKVGGNDFDYELVAQEFTFEQATFIAQAVKEWCDEDEEEVECEDEEYNEDDYFDEDEDDLPF